MAFWYKVFRCCQYFMVPNYSFFFFFSQAIITRFVNSQLHCSNTAFFLLTQCTEVVLCIHKRVQYSRHKKTVIKEKLWKKRWYMPFNHSVLLQFSFSLSHFSQYVIEASFLHSCDYNEPNRPAEETSGLFWVIFQKRWRFKLGTESKLMGAISNPLGDSTQLTYVLS